jgi:hypothetical protein
MAAAGIPFLVMKVRTKLAARKQPTQKGPDIDSELEEVSDSEHLIPISHSQAINQGKSE